MRLHEFTKEQLLTEKFYNSPMCPDHYMQADENGYFVVYTRTGKPDCWKMLEVESLIADDWEIYHD